MGWWSSTMWLLYFATAVWTVAEEAVECKLPESMEWHPEKWYEGTPSAAGAKLVGCLRELHTLFRSVCSVLYFQPAVRHAQQSIRLGSSPGPSQQRWREAIVSWTIQQRAMLEGWSKSHTESALTVNNCSSVQHFCAAWQASFLQLHWTRWASAKDLRSKILRGGHPQHATRRFHHMMLRAGFIASRAFGYYLSIMPCTCSTSRSRPLSP